MFYFTFILPLFYNTHWKDQRSRALAAHVYYVKLLPTWNKDHLSLSIYKFWSWFARSFGHNSHCYRSPRRNVHTWTGRMRPNRDLSVVVTNELPCGQSWQVRFTITFLLRSYDTLYRWHLLGIGQTKIIYYNLVNLPDISGKIEKKLIFVEYVPILIIPAYYKLYPMSFFVFGYSDFQIHWIWCFDTFSGIMCDNSYV